MAGEAMILPDERMKAGYRIIELTDSVGFDATGAGWGYTKASASWRFYLFTPMADTKGPLWLWQRLAQAFSRLELPEGITPLDIVVASPDEGLYRGLFIKSGTTPPGIGMMASFDVSHMGYGLNHIWLLRSRPESSLLRSIAKREAMARRFDTKVQRLMAA